MMCNKHFLSHYAHRDAGIREAECERTAMDVKYSTDTKIEDNSRMFKLQKANFDQEVNTAVNFKIKISLNFPIQNFSSSFFTSETESRVCSSLRVASG